MGCKFTAVFCTALTMGAMGASSAFATPTTYEAEDIEGIDAASIVEASKVYETDMSKGWQIYDTTKTIDVSGGKFVEASAIQFSVEVTETAMYDLRIHLWIQDLYVSNNTSVTVDDNELGQYSTTTGTYNNKEFLLEGSVKLKAGISHIIEIKAASKAGIDYLSLERHPSAEFKISATPVTPGATESAQKLMTFIRDNFMKKSISGMMIGDNAFNYHYGATLEDSYLIEKCIPDDSCSYTDERTTWKGQEDISEFNKRSGHYPALGGFDLLFATGGHSDEGWFSGYTDNSIRMAKELWNYGGIPAFTWHWKVGQDTVFYVKSNGFENAACTDGVQDSDKDNTCFNYAKAFKDNSCKEIDTESDEYKLLIADIDKVSKRLLSLQEEGVAVVWRPLHEAAGGWFWWGINGPDCYKALYKMVFERMVNTNGVKNALWVWNIERDPSIGYDYSALNPEWYPGDEYVDIVGVDIYNSSGDHNSNAKYFNKITADIGTKKVIALTENGPIPDVDSTFEDESVWSFWMPWYNTWSSGFLNQTDDAVWKRNLDDARIIALDDMPGWDNVVADTDKEGAIIAPAAIPYVSRAATARSMSISQNGRVLEISIGKEAVASIGIFDMLGHKVASLIQGNMSAGSTQFDLHAFANGSYIVRAKIGNEKYTHKITLK